MEHLPSVAVAVVVVCHRNHCPVCYSKIVLSNFRRLHHHRQQDVVDDGVAVVYWESCWHCCCSEGDGSSSDRLCVVVSVSSLSLNVFPGRASVLVISPRGQSRDLVSILQPICWIVFRRIKD